MWRRVVLTLGLLLVLAADVAAARAKIASYREYPYGACRFVDEQFHVTPDHFQEQALIAWVDPSIQRISLQAAAGVGKSAVMAWCAWHFLGVQCLDPIRHPKGLVTGVTDANLRDNFWAEMATWQGASPWLSTAFTPPSLPIPLPPYSRASVLISSVQRPASGTPAR